MCENPSPSKAHVMQMIIKEQPTCTSEQTISYQKHTQILSLLVPTNALF
jgi:hypothetical protein